MEMSSLKEQLDQLSCDYGRELIEAGCWAALSEATRRRIGEAARSAWQPSDDEDNRTGRRCGTEAVVTSLCLLHAPMQVHEGKGGRFFSGVDYCKDCCTRNGIPMNTPDGPGAGRPWGNCAGLFPEYAPDIVRY